MKFSYTKNMESVSFFQGKGKGGGEGTRESDFFIKNPNLKRQGLTNPLSHCPGQVKIFARQVKIFLTCPEKCINYIGKTNEFQSFLTEAICLTSKSDFDLSNPEK